MGVPSVRKSYAGRSPGIATVIAVIVIVIIVAVAAVAAYVFVAAPAGSSGTSSSTMTSSTSITSTTSASSTTSHTTATSTTSTATISTTGSQTLQKYTGTFSYSLPLGPSGERVVNNTAESYGSVQVASGSFTFFINPANYSGTGTGTGTMTITTTGFCSGSVNLPYTFDITNANDLLGGNITVAFGIPRPSNATVPLTCTGSMTGVSQANNPIAFLSVYPNLVSVKSVPATLTAHLTGNITYSVTITPAS